MGPSMTAYDDVMRELREFSRYTGDGKPGAPVNAPLPIGDPQSGPHNPKKANLRLALGNLAQELMAGITIVNGALPAISAARATALANIETARTNAIDDVQSWTPEYAQETREAVQAAEVATAADRAQTGADVAATATNAALASAAKDAAFANANVYPDIATGRAAVADGQQFQVVSGLETIRYRRDSSTTQTEVARFPTAAAVKAIPAQLGPVQLDAEVLEDDAGNQFRRTSASGHQYIPYLGGRSVQEAIGQTDGRVQQGNGLRGRDVLIIQDAEGNIALRQDVRGALYAPGDPIPLQAQAGGHVSRVAPYYPSSREKLHDLIKPMVADLLAEGKPFVHPPSLLVPNRYDVPDGIINAFKITAAGTPQLLETPYNEGGTVHPYLLEMRKPILGYRYLLGETPYRRANAREENPVIYGSNDLVKFDLIPDIEQPLGHPPLIQTVYNSDIAFTYDPRNGELVCLWRQVDQSVSPQAISFHCRSTWNGFDWSPEVSYAMPVDGKAPSILYDPDADIWHLWGVQDTNVLSHWTGPSYLGPWGNRADRDFNTLFGLPLWHCEVKWLGSRFAILAESVGTGSQVRLGLSSNGDDWTLGADIFDPQRPAIYKPTFIPQFRGDEMRLMVAWNNFYEPLPADLKQTFQCEPTNWVNLTTL